MKKITKLFIAVLTTSLLVSCVSKPDIPGFEEKVEYKDISYKPENKEYLTEKELREDCDMLKYIVYNTYAGIDEAIDLGLDLDATIEDIYNQTLKKKFPHNGLYSSTDFNSIIRSTFSKNIKNTDQHVSIGGSLRDSVNLRYSNIYFEKKGDEYFVVKSDSDEIKTGDKYTGPESNLYKFLSDNGEIYRYCLMTSKNIKSAVISVNDQKVNVKAEAEKVIPSKGSWTGFQVTDKTLYMSLGDCSQAYGVDDVAESFSNVWDTFLANISKNAKGKENIIFDLRSNPGGYMQFPSKMLTAAYYYNHADDKEFQKQINALFWNKACQDCTHLTSPVIMQIEKQWMKKSWKNELESYNQETQDYFNYYFSHMKTNPIRKHIPLDFRACDYTQFPAPDFQGNVYVLINSGSASAAEFGTQMAFLLQDQGIKVTLVGENSWGGIKYGGMNGLCLPHSGVFCRLGIYFGESPTLQSLPNWHGEGNGYFPDYWATNDVILNTLVNLTGDEQLTQTLDGLDKGQL